MDVSPLYMHVAEDCITVPRLKNTYLQINSAVIYLLSHFVPTKKQTSAHRPDEPPDKLQQSPDKGLSTKKAFGASHSK